MEPDLWRSGDPTPDIVAAGLGPEPTCPLCAATVSLFVSILGSIAGNLALAVVSTGGVYLGGGIPPRILPAVDKALFLDAFQHKGRLSYLTIQMPVHVILNRDVGLIGAATYGLQNMQKG